MRPWLLKLRNSIPPGARKRFAGMTQTFVSEVGVLMGVFPILETIVYKGMRGVTQLLVWTSFGAAIFCFTLAGIISVYNPGEPQ
jgi:hypothetical protein